MAANTNIELNRQMIYSLFVRNHTYDGTFRALEKDLDRIKALGTDIIWLLPIYPTGEQMRKGGAGSPYAVRDHRGIDPSMGTETEFRHLVDEIHKRGMKCLIDIVFNHTSPDSVLFCEHPDFFRKDSSGRPGSLVAEWTDIIDLDYNIPELWRYQIDALKGWAKIVDGFRADSAFRTPVSFWIKARKEVADIAPDTIWLAESGDPFSIKFVRDSGLYAAGDRDLYEAFDICYDYDIRHTFAKYMDGKIPLSSYIERIAEQEAYYPENFIKLRCLENHDQPRFASLCESVRRGKNWLAFNFFLKGTAMIYEGEEFLSRIRPDIFDQDCIWDHRQGDLSDHIAKCAHIKKAYIPLDSIFKISCNDERETVCCAHITPSESVYGLFCLGNEQKVGKTKLPDGKYKNLMTDNIVQVVNGYVGNEDELPFITVFDGNASQVIRQ